MNHLERFKAIAHFQQPDYVPIFEEHSARLDAGVRIAEWEGMDGWEKALVVAQRRMKNALENIQSEAQIEAARRHAGRGMRK